ncbi:MAG: two-component regulator propeller domain-containing protein [Bacteroidota bacterium]
MKKSILIHWILFLSLGSFSCQENAKNIGSRSKVEPQATIGTSDSRFHFTNQMYSIFEDSKGSFWIGSKENGLCRYKDKVYTYFTTDDGLPSNSVPNIQEDENGNIWVESSKKITQFDGRQFINFDKKYIPTLNIKEHPIQLAESDLWFRDQNKIGIYRYDGNDLSFISFEDSTLNLTLKYDHFFVSSITSVVNDQVWFGTLMQGAIGLDGQTFDKINDESFRFTSDEEFLHIRSMLLDSKDNLWIGNNGIGVLLKQEDSLIHFSKVQGKLIPMDAFEANTNQKEFAKNIGLQSVFTIEEDREGSIWFGDRDSGAWKYDGKQLYQYSHIYQKEDVEALIWDIYCAKNGSLYFVLANGTAFTFDGNAFHPFVGFEN